MSEKREVVMRNVTDAVLESGTQMGFVHEARDFVPVEDLDAYVADARTRWASVEII